MFFMYSDVLYLLVIPFMLLLLSLRKTTNTQESVFCDSVRKVLELQPNRLRGVVRYRYFLLVIALLIIALARPVSLKQTSNIKHKSLSAVIALDVSKSMHGLDLYPNRLSLAKVKLLTLLQKAQSLHVSIILFAKNAYMLYPLSEDTQALADMFKNAHIEQKFEPNTNLFCALQAGEKILHNEKIKNIILLTDGGEDRSRAEEIAYIIKNNLKLYTLDFTPNSNHSLRAMTQKSEGFYAKYRWGEGDVANLLSVLESNAQEMTVKKYALKHYQEFFSYPLALALLILYVVFFMHSSKPFKIKLLVFFVGVQLSVATALLDAGILDFIKLHEAQTSYEKKEYAKAVSIYKSLEPSKEINYNIAAALYKEQRYLEAIEYYKRALGANKVLDAKVFYNIADCYVKRGKLEAAKSSFERSLRLHVLQQTKKNLQLVKEELKKRKKLKKIFTQGAAKICFKNIQGRDNSKKISSNYTIKLQKLVLSQEQKWMKIVQKQKMPVFLQKIRTTRSSNDTQNPR